MNEATTDVQNAPATEQTTMASLAAGIPESDEGGANQGTNEAANSSDSQSGKQANIDEMQQFFTSQRSNMEALQNQVKTAADTISQVAQREQQRLLDAAVDNAVATINKSVGGNESLAETFLNNQYAKNPDFKKIFDNRDENPEALEKAIGILANEWKAMNRNTTDPQVAENQRALEESQRPGGQASAEVSDDQARRDKMGDGEFLRSMRNLASSG